jgi:hypothetical protein
MKTNEHDGVEHAAESTVSGANLLLPAKALTMPTNAHNRAPGGHRLSNGARG